MMKVLRTEKLRLMKEVFCFLFTALFTLLSSCDGVGSSNITDFGSTDPAVVGPNHDPDSVLGEPVTDPLFRSTWVISGSGVTITLPLVEDYNYNFTVDWGDGSSSEITAHDDLDKTHTYEDSGDYNLVIEGLLEAWSFNDVGDKNKILSVESFGDLGYKNLSGAFYGCANLSTFKGGFTSSVTNMFDMFFNAKKVNPDVRGWDVSSVTNMSGMFAGTSEANPDVRGWDVSSVTDMSYMFAGARSADPDVRGWDVSSVTNMIGMFNGTTIANPDVSGWNVSNVTDMSYMFSDVRSANPDVSGWNVSNVTDMSSMFSNARSVDPDVSQWKVSSVTNMRGMFNGTTIANPDVSGWDVPNVADMSYMFFNAKKVNPDVRGWDVSSVTSMEKMFDNSKFSTENYDAFLIKLASTSLASVVLGASGIKYSSDAAKTARDTLTGRGWTITDGGDARP